MKKRMLLLVVSIGFTSLYSCESEYNKRKQVAIKLKTELDDAVSKRQITGQVQLQTIQEIEHEILVEAKASGNERLMLEELQLDYLMRGSFSER